MRYRIVIAGALALLPVAALTTIAQEPGTTNAAFWGEPTVDGGKCCRSLGEVRDNIDRIDKRLVALIAERGRYVHEAARFKKNPAEVEAPQRAEFVVQKARKLAEANGLSPAIAEATYRAMVGGFIAYEQGVFANMAKPAGGGERK